MLKRIWQSIKYSMKPYAPTPPCPDNCITVLAVTDGRVHGWQTPKSYRDNGIRYFRGTHYVFITQDTIDCFIPPHSEEVDEQIREEREWKEMQEERRHVGEVG